MHVAAHSQKIANGAENAVLRASGGPYRRDYSVQIGGLVRGNCQRILVPLAVGTHQFQLWSEWAVSRAAYLYIAAIEVNFLI